MVIAALATSARADSPAEDAERLSWRWAPVYVQHVASDDSGRDRPTRIDFDGNWNATDNWRNQAAFGTRLPPAAYGAAILTDTHAYLTYSLYYPRDWARLCISFVCHDNDLETLQLVVERDAQDGKLVEVRTKAHHAITDTTAANVARTADGRPIVRVESHGHGITVCKPGDPLCEPRAGRIVYEPGRTPSQPPVKATGQRVSYQLLSLHKSLWPLRSMQHGRLWTPGESGPMSYDGMRFGRLGNVMGAAMATTKFLGGVRPPWALRGAFGKRGDWFLDPAGRGEPAPLHIGPAAKDASTAPKYAYNPFLDDLAAECRGPRCKPAPKERSRARYLFKLGAPYLALSLGAVLVGGLLRHHARDLRF